MWGNRLEPLHGNSMISSLPDLHRDRVLVIDGDVEWRGRLSRVLAEEGYRVAAAETWQQVLRELTGQEPPDAVVLASELQGGGARDLLSQVLAQDPSLTVLLSAPHGGVWGDFSSWGADEYVVKSSDASELKSKLARALARRRPTQAA